MPKQSTAEKIVARTQSMIREITDPVELRRQIEEMFATEFPKSEPIFVAGEKLKMHQFLSRYQSKICGGIVPSFYDVDIEVLAVDRAGISIEIFLAPHASRLMPHIDSPADPSPAGAAEGVKSDGASPSPGVPAPTPSAHLDSCEARAASREQERDGL